MKDFSKNKYYVFDKQWMHKSPIKLLVNPILRRLQFFTDRPYVIGSETEFVEGKPQFIKYKFVRVLFIK